MTEDFCQSCAMPLKKDSDYGKEKNGSLSEEYCSYCYENGKFTEDYTMDEMIVHCANFVEEFNKDSEEKLTKEQAISQMKLYFPKLKRWK